MRMLYFLLLILFTYQANAATVQEWRFDTQPYTSNITIGSIILEFNKIASGMFYNCSTTDRNISPATCPSTTLTTLYSVELTCPDENGIVQSLAGNTVVLYRSQNGASVSATQSNTTNKSKVTITNGYGIVYNDMTINCLATFTLKASVNSSIMREFVVNGVNMAAGDTFTVPFIIYHNTPLSAELTDLSGHQQVHTGEALSWKAHYTVNTPAPDIYMSSTECDRYNPVITIGNTQYHSGETIVAAPRSGDFTYSVTPPAAGHYTCTVVVNFQAL